MKNHEYLTKKINLLCFTGTKTSRKVISCPIDALWVKYPSQSLLSEGVTYDYWTCVPKSGFRKSDWKGCCIGEVANMMIQISLTSIVANPELDSNLIEGPELMRQFGLNYRVLACINEYKKTFALSQVALITLVDSPDKCMMTRQIFRTPMTNEAMLETSMGWESLVDLPYSDKYSYWYLLPKQKGTEVWNKLREYANSLYDGKPVDSPYELAHEFKFDDLSDIPEIVRTQERFVKQFGILPDKTLQLK